MRRPTTTDTKAFYYISQEKWDGFVIESKGQDKQKAKGALNHLRKFDVAGRIMETDEGIDAPSPCAWCTRKGREELCRVFADKEKAEACAYCRRMAKSGCTAYIVEPVVVVPPSAEELAELKGRLEMAEGVIAGQGELIKVQDATIQKQSRHLRAVIKELANVTSDLEVVWQRLYPRGEVKRAS